MSNKSLLWRSTVCVPGRGYPFLYISFIQYYCWGKKTGEHQLRLAVSIAISNGSQVLGKPRVPGKQWPKLVSKKRSPMSCLNHLPCCLDAEILSCLIFVGQWRQSIDITIFFHRICWTCVWFWSRFLPLKSWHYCGMKQCGWTKKRITQSLRGTGTFSCAGCTCHRLAICSTSSGRGNWMWFLFFFFNEKWLIFRGQNEVEAKMFSLTLSHYLFFFSQFCRSL